AWTRPLGPVPDTGHRLRPVWEHTAALTEAWRERRGVPAGVEGLGPRPTTTREAAAFDEMSTRIRALSRRTHATAQAQRRGEAAHTFVRATHRRLNAAQSAPTAHPVELATDGQSAALMAEAAFALRDMLATGQAPEPWMDHIPAPAPDDEDQQHLWIRLTHHISDWRKRRHHSGTDPLGPRPSDAAATEWQHLSEALNHYRHARITQRLTALQHPRPHGSLAQGPAAPRPHSTPHPASGHHPPQPF
ncbi:hypothetical protein ACFWA7_29240, partial [Streptomyces sp. NPDC059994]